MSDQRLRLAGRRRDDRDFEACSASTSAAIPARAPASRGQTSSSPRGGPDLRADRLCPTRRLLAVSALRPPHQRPHPARFSSISPATSSPTSTPTRGSPFSGHAPQSSIAHTTSQRQGTALRSDNRSTALSAARGPRRGLAAAQCFTSTRSTVFCSKKTWRPGRRVRAQLDYIDHVRLAAGRDHVHVPQPEAVRRRRVARERSQQGLQPLHHRSASIAARWSGATSRVAPTG